MANNYGRVHVLLLQLKAFKFKEDVVEAKTANS